MFDSAKGFDARMTDFDNHLHSRYLLSFQPAQPHPGLHRLTVRLKEPGQQPCWRAAAIGREGNASRLQRVDATAEIHLGNRMNCHYSAGVGARICFPPWKADPSLARDDNLKIPCV